MEIAAKHRVMHAAVMDASYVPVVIGNGLAMPRLFMASGGMSDGLDDFKSLRAGRGYHVDKTRLIEQILDSG